MHNMIIQAVNPRRQNSRRDASFALLPLSLWTSSPPSQLPSTEYFSCLSLRSLFLSFIILCALFYSSSSRLLLHAVLSSAALLCRIALFVKPTTPSSLPPSWLYSTPPRLRRIRGDSPELQPETLLLYATTTFRLDISYCVVCGKSCSVASRRGRSLLAHC